MPPPPASPAAGPDGLDDVLARVAAGQLTPAQALDLLGPTEPDDEGAPAMADRPPTAAGGRRPRPPDYDGPRRLVLRTSARSIQITTDPSVHEVAIDGDHELHRDGDDLVVENPTALEDRTGRYSYASSIARALPQLGSTLVIRMNPDLALAAELNAAALKLHGTPAGIRLRLLATSVKFDGYVGSVDIDAAASSIKGVMTLVGQNRIDCESTSCKLSLSPNSDVTIRSQNQMGKMVLPGAVVKGAITGSESAESVIGQGRGSLAIEATMSSVVIAIQ
jgi:hypothetical protein